MTHVLARITARADTADKVRQVLVELAEQSRTETGCVAYTLFQRSDDPVLFQTVEQWRDGAAVDAHMASKHVGAAVAQVGALLAAPPEILRFDRLA